MAYSVLHLVHRDVSLGNIILYPDYSTAEWKVYKKLLDLGDYEGGKKAMGFMVCKAILIDWELAIRYPRTHDARQYVMTVGTLRFI